MKVSHASGPRSRTLEFQRTLYVKLEHFVNQKDKVMKYTLFCGWGEDIVKRVLKNSVSMFIE